MPRKQESVTAYESDVLVVGGGMAGFFAALCATRNGQRVVLVDKGSVGRSGFTPWANTFCVFDEALGDRAEDWIAGAQAKGEYLVNLDYFSMFMQDSGPRYRQLLDLGVIDERAEWEKDSGVPARDYLKGRDRRALLPSILKKAGVTLVQRVMLTQLLRYEGRVVGAVGFHMEEGEPLVFSAKATVLCTGAGGYKAPGYPIHSCTFDGDAMAYEAGARIAGKDFMDFHFTGDQYPWNVLEMQEHLFVNRIYPTGGPRVAGEGVGIYPIFTVHEQAPPLQTFDIRDEPPSNPDDPRGKGKYATPRMPGGNIVMGAATGLGVHKSEGVWPADAACFSGVPGLYAAGDALASMICGASYPSTGMGLAGSAVQGFRAGEAAAAHAAGEGLRKAPEELIAAAKTQLLAPLEAQRGFNPRWVSQVLLNTMAPYYVLLVMNAERLHSALTQIEFMQQYFATRMKANDLHELRLVHEARNMLLNAEMKLRANLFRTESRGNHYRQDFPARNDSEWLAWTLVSKGDDGAMQVGKEPVPEPWRGDLSQAYMERYPRRFPGEREYLGKTTQGREK